MTTSLPKRTPTTPPPQPCPPPPAGWFGQPIPWPTHDPDETRQLLHDTELPDTHEALAVLTRVADALRREPTGPACINPRSPTATETTLIQPQEPP
jgi:hypothetical protein